MLGYSRQYYYKQQKDIAKQEQKKLQVRELVHKERKQLPRLGTRKVYHLIKPVLADKNIKLGRDKLFALLKEYGLLIKPRKRYIQTTMSRHWLKKWPNLTKQLAISEPDQVWVSDITYIKTQEGNSYLNMITDAYSRKIVGYAVEDNMETGSMIKALEQAVKHKVNPNQLTIHHSDRGLQYCSREYGIFTSENNIRLSMTENSDPYENALAERMNRTIKEEFGLDKLMLNRQQVKQVIKESIALYNQKRPHLALKMKTPNEVYSKQKSRLHEATGII